MLTAIRNCEDDAVRLLVERWCIDGITTPYLVETIALNVSCADVQWALYSTPCSRKIPFVPRSTSIISAGGVAFLDAQSGLRVGSRIMLTKDDLHGLQQIHSEKPVPQAGSLRIKGEAPSDENVPDQEIPDPLTIQIPKDASILKEYCEEIARKGDLLVICRRKIPKPEISDTAEKKTSRRNRHSRTRHDLSDSSGDESGSDDGQASDGDDDENGDGGAAFSDANSLKSAASSDTLRSISDDSESSDESSSDHESENASSMSDDFNMVSDSEESNDGLDLCAPSEDAEEEDTDGSDISSLLSVATSDSSDEEAHDIYFNEEDNMEIGGHYEYPVGITGQPQARSKGCDSCGESQPETWYHCAICHYNNYDLCHDCVKRGQWCLKKEHQLYEEVSEVGVVSVISWSDFVLGQEILIFDTSSTVDEPFFKHSMSESATLHQSAPIIHPLLPLVVWPICAGKLLFVDTSKRNARKKQCFSLQPFKATSSKGKLLPSRRTVRIMQSAH